tara:strand:- start:2210 stop:2866 length:657 start_codon:yes stop_codon:yes gene_type:complete
MNCDQIIYLGIFAIVAIYLYQNVLTPSRVEFFTPGEASAPPPSRPQTRGPPNPDAVARANANAVAVANAQARANRANSVEPPSDAPVESPGSEVRASEKLGKNEMSAPVQFNRTPSSCYPQESLTAKDLLPNDESANITEFNQNYPIGQGILNGINFLSSGYSIGVNTVGQSLKNANRQLRSEPPNPQVSVSPWMNSSIGPDLLRRPLEVGDSCGASA